MIKNRDIVVVGIQAWDIEIGSNCKNLATEMAKNNRVLYVNNPLNRFEYYKQRNDAKVKRRINILKNREDSISPISENFWEFNPKTIVEPVNRIGSNLIFDFFNKINSKRLATEIQRAVNELGFKNYILFNDSSMFLGNHFNEFLEYEAQIYYIRDNLVNSPFPFWNTHGKRMEPKIIKKADVVVTNSLYYAEYAKQFNNNSYMVGQGCDVSLFDSQVREIGVAEDLKEIEKPIIGYVGNLAGIRLDIDLLEYVAKERKDWQIVLVGPQDDAFKSSNLHNLDNVHFLGSRPSEQLPNYIQGFDICINPQVLNITTIGNYPRKIDEYLAMGKPTVATQTKAMEYFAEWVYLGENKQDYVRLIQHALDEDSLELAKQRREYALTHSWENNVKSIWDSLAKVK